MILISKSSFKDLESSSDDDEDFVQTRKQFQQARSVSTASRKTISFFDMEMSNKDENIRNSVPFVRQITEDGKAKLEIYRPTTNPIYIYTQVSLFVRFTARDALITTGECVNSSALSFHVLNALKITQLNQRVKFD
jgi:facilitated trehalose transporter